MYRNFIFQYHVAFIYGIALNYVESDLSLILSVFLTSFWEVFLFSSFLSKGTTLNQNFPIVLFLIVIWSAFSLTLNFYLLVIDHRQCASF